MADYIVVGGGSAGCVVAGRLGEDPKASVLLLEQGGRDWHPYLHVPVTYSKLYQSGVLKRYELEPVAAQGGRTPLMVQANVLGGGSSVNGMVYIRGCPEDYDGWAANGCLGWSYDEVLPFFTRAEDNESLAGPAHGSGGPVGVSDQRYTHPLTKEWLKACQDAGMPYNPDFNSGRQAGCGLYQLTTRGGRRSSTAGYLRAARRRGNLEVGTGVTVLRILVEHGRAVGVEYLRGGRTMIARAEREVIVCAGGIGSPHLLLRSGIGPADDLRERGLAVVHALPGVGSNLQDHTIVYLLYDLNRTDSFDRYRKLHWQAWAGLQYALFRAGPATSNVIEGGAFWHGQSSDPLPDLQACFFPGVGVEDGMEGVPSGYGCSLAVGQSRPRSRGFVKLRSADPLAPPIVNPRHLADPYDVHCLAEGVRIAQELMRQPAIGRHIRAEHIPGRPLASADEREAFVRENTIGALHPSGGCKMGMDDMAVVDPQLRVHGIEGLRVADTSIMPSIPSGNLNAPAIMVGERAAAFICGNR